MGHITTIIIRGKLVLVGCKDENVNQLVNGEQMIGSLSRYNTPRSQRLQMLSNFLERINVTIRCDYDTSYIAIVSSPDVL